jgi:predicted  nucleic acid-binding Zn-ribbon protein
LDKKADSSSLNGLAAETYVDEKITTEVANRNSAIDSAKTSAISTAASDATTKVTTHNVATDAHNDIRVLINDLTTQLNNFLDVDDTTKDQLSEVITLIENNKGTLESLTTNKINVTDIINNLTTASANKVLSANQGVEIKKLIDALESELDNHTHEIGDISGL